MFIVKGPKSAVVVAVAPFDAPTGIVARLTLCLFLSRMSKKLQSKDKRIPPGNGRAECLEFGN